MMMVVQKMTIRAWNKTKNVYFLKDKNIKSS